MKHTILGLLLIFYLFVSPACIGQDSKLEGPTVASIAEKVRPSIVVVTTENREGVESDMGTGFVIAPGLIATSLHVIGEARPIWIQTVDGERFEVIEVHASDRNFDLAVLRVDLKKKTLPSLDLGLGELSEGQPVVAIGHPLGLKNSVVSGLVAGVREFGDASMYQIAMVIEPGNSGGPLVNMSGEVHGVVALKSTGPNSFGFAVKVDQLRKLLKTPNPIAIKRWKTIGQLDANRWTPLMGARWRQRGGRILVEPSNEGPFGRSLLLRADKTPEPPFEVAVSVKLDDEAGAAGLVFHSDGKNKHYGFYPSNGQLRLTNFDGPTVYSWNVLRESPVASYRPNEWNEIRVRVEKDRILAFVNDRQAFSVDGVEQPVGTVGLCKFRNTKAEFKHFRFGKAVKSFTVSAKRKAELLKQLDGLDERSELSDKVLSELATDLPARRRILEEKAREWERRADELRELWEDLHVAAVCSELKSLADQKDAQIDLLRGALLIAKLDNDELEVDAYFEIVDSMVSQVKASFDEQDSDSERLQKLDKFLFEQSGFHGSRTEYYRTANSHMDRIIDDREGLPITLSVLYMSLAKKLGLNVVGVGLPGHFVVRHEPEEGKQQLIDVFDRGNRLSRSEANVMIIRTTGVSPDDELFEASSHRSILLRILTNLMGLAQRDKDAPAARRYAEAMAAVDLNDKNLLGTRAIMRHQAGRKQAALDDLDAVIDAEPEGPRKDQLRQIRIQLQSQ